MAVSPDGKEIAVVIRGDVFVTSADYKTTKRITNTPEQERDVSFSKDGRELYYSAERNGHWGIYKTSLTDKREKRFTYACPTNLLTIHIDWKSAQLDPKSVLESNDPAATVNMDSFYDDVTECCVGYRASGGQCYKI